MPLVRICGGVMGHMIPTPTLGCTSCVSQEARSATHVSYDIVSRPLTA